MRLIAFRITDFRCFADSGWVTVPTGPLSIVGKNEAGKSALLYALSQLTATAADFVPVRDWPRFKRQSERAEQTPVVHARFQLSASEQRLLGEIDSTTADTTVVSVTRGYDGVRRLRFEDHIEPRYSKDFASILKRLADDEALDSQTRAIAGGLAVLTAWSGSGLVQLRSLLSVLPEGSSTGKDIARLVQETDAVEKRQSAKAWVSEHLPKFHYFSSYELISGELNVDEYIRRRNAQTETQGERLFALACDLSGLDLDELSELSYEDPRESQERSQLAREASLEITDAIGRIWQQRRGHKSEFRVDGPLLRMEVSDDVLDQPVPLDARSLGFRWFYSFYVLFQAQASGLFKDGILLLDEPGMSLHGRAQQDLVALMRGLSAQNQIAYTTHSPFMLATDNLDDVVVVEDRAGGSRVADSIWSVDPDNSFPIQYALGFDIAGFNFGCIDHLIVEGVSDYYFIEGIRELLRQCDRPDPLRGVGIVPAGGAARVLSQVNTSLGQGHHIRVLLDDDPQGRAQRDEILKAKVLPDKSIKLLELPDSTETAIEDLIGEESYKTLVRNTYENELGEKTFRVSSKGAPQIAKRVESSFVGLGLALNKVRVARKFSDLVRSGGWRTKASDSDLDRYSEALAAVAALRSYARN